MPSGNLSYSEGDRSKSINTCVSMGPMIKNQDKASKRKEKGKKKETRIDNLKKNFFFLYLPERERQQARGGAERSRLPAECRA